MNDDRFDEYLREAARNLYNPPPPPPREAMWARIDEARRFRRPRRHGGPLGWWRHGLGIAAVLAVGIGIGHLLDRPGAAPVTAGVEDPTAGPAERPPRRTPASSATPGAAPFRLVAVQHLSRSEALLTAFRASSIEEKTDVELTAWARELLTGTRLLLDSPAADDPRIRSLLQDLELILAQIAQISLERADEEVDLIDRALAEHGVLTRLRSAVPAGPLEVRS